MSPLFLHGLGRRDRMFFEFFMQRFVVDVQDSRGLCLVVLRQQQDLQQDRSFDRRTDALD